MFILRAKYTLLKEECRQMFPLIGSGRFITAPIVTEDGEPIKDPIVLQEANLDPDILNQANGIAESSADL